MEMGGMETEGSICVHSGKVQTSVWLRLHEANLVISQVGWFT